VADEGHEVLGAPEGGRVLEPDARDVRAVAEVIRAGHCTLFLGAGVHSAPPAGSRWAYGEKERPLRGGELSTHLAAATRYAEQYPDEQVRNLGRVSLYCELHEKYGRKWLIEEVRKQVHTGKKPSPALRGLTELGFPLIATTNYDQLIEDALAAHGRKPSVSIYDRRSSTQTNDYTGDEIDPTPEQPFLLKIHGDIGIPESLVITDEDYIGFVLRMSDKEPFNPLPPSFRYAFSRYPTLFIGYSLLDYNLRLLFKTLRWNVDKARLPTTYAVDPFPDRLIHNVYDQQEKLVRFIVTDVWSFVPMLYKAVMGKDMP
jgi:hypothetical protein